MQDQGVRHRQLPILFAVPPPTDETVSLVPAFDTHPLRSTLQSLGVLDRAPLTVPVNAFVSAPIRPLLLRQARHLVDAGVARWNPADEILIAHHG